MKTLAASSSSKLFSGTKGGGGFWSPKDVLGRGEICFVKYQKHGTLGLVSLQTKTILPIFSLSSSSSSSDSPISVESEADLEAAETQTQKTYESNTVHVKFQLQKDCLFGEKFLIVGDDPMFGLWDPSNAIPMDWSEGHVWTVELDIPIGKSIQFKFILKGSMGNILWQPGPDRILNTWETKNTITVVEDWENAECQKVMEDGSIPIGDESTVSSDMSIVSEILTPQPQGGEQMDEINKTSIITDSIYYTAENTPMETIVDENIVQSPEKPLSIVADNISYAKEESLENANTMVTEKNITYPKEESLENANTMVTEKNITYPKEEPMTVTNHDSILANAILGHNGRAAVLNNPLNAQNEENLANYEGGPVLVPGLSPFSAIQTEEGPLNQGERSLTMDASVRPDEAELHNIPELNEEQEHKCDKQKEESNKRMFNRVELHDSELHKKPGLVEEEDQPDLTVTNNKVWRSDIQWVQKLLSNLGLF